MPSGSTPPNLSKNSGSPTRPASGSILNDWGITARQLTELVNENPSLRGIMLGYVAEHKFKELIERHPHISGTRKYDDHDRSRRSDRIIVYKGEEFSIEVKSLQTNSIRRVGDDKWIGKAQVDASDRRNVMLPSGKKLNTTLLLRGEFDILAVNCFGFEGKWNFAFALNRDLPGSTYRKYSKAQRAALIASLIPVTWPPESPFVSDPFPLVEQLHRERKRTSHGTSASKF